jgi:hypothetical protein
VQPNLVCAWKDAAASDEDMEPQEKPQILELKKQLLSMQREHTKLKVSNNINTHVINLADAPTSTPFNRSQSVPRSHPTSPKPTLKHPDSHPHYQKRKQVDWVNMPSNCSSGISTFSGSSLTNINNLCSRSSNTKHHQKTGRIRE